MKTRLGLSLLTSILLQTNLTMGQWTKQSAFPADRHLNSVSMVSPTHAFVCGENRYLLESTDGGANWSVNMSSDFGTEPFYRIHFADANHGYITGNNNDGWRTTNGGLSWIQMTAIPAGSWSHIDFITSTQGFIGANGALAYTSNGGVSWNLKSGYPTCPVIYGMDFFDTQLGLAGGYLVQSAEEGIFRTTNGGATWTKKLAASANDVLWVTSQEAIAIIGTLIYKSTNAGETWSPVSNVIHTGLLSLGHPGGTTFVGVSGAGDIWRSDNGGINWVMVLDGIGDLPTNWDISFYDDLNGFVVGQSGIIYSSHDGGLTWTMMNCGMGIQLFDLEMQSPTYGLAACHNGYVLRTTNGGAWWETSKVEVTGQIFGRDESLRGVSIVDEEFAVLAGPGGTVFRTYDSGLTWESVGYPELPGLFWIDDVEFVSQSDGWLVGTDLDFGANKTVYRTLDGGDTWTLAMSQGSNMYSVDFVDPQHGWIGTIGSLFFRTTNGGTTWIQGTLPGNPQSPRLRFSSINEGWAVGWFGYVARTTNGGATWTLQTTGWNDNHLRVHAVSSLEAWIVGAEPSPSLAGVVYHTTNAGVSWSREVLTEFPYTFSVVSAFPTGEAWIGGYGGNILSNRETVVGQPPVVSDIPDQTIVRGDRFAPLRMDNYVTDPDNTDPEISWTWSGNNFLLVVLDPVRQRIRVRGPNNWTGSETIVFTATDPTGLSDSDGATFTVTAAARAAGETEIGQIPEVTELLGNYPNPFNPTTTIRYTLHEKLLVSIKVYSVIGEEVAVLVDGVKEAGSYEVVLNARELSSGMYFYRLVAGDVVDVRRLAIVK